LRDSDADHLYCTRWKSPAVEIAGESTELLTGLEWEELGGFDRYKIVYIGFIDREKYAISY